MKQRHLTVSVVIPVYNDEKYLNDCLVAIAQQSVLPNEVIVVDNNCTDDSMHIAKQFDFIKIINEKRQGLSFARNAGLNAATGDVLVRIDADTVLPTNYIASLKQKVISHPHISGFTGYGTSRYSFIPKLSLPFSWGYFTFSHAYLGYPMLWGANMVIKRDAWNKLKPLLFNNDLAVHEDQDVSLALASIGGKVEIFRDLTVSVNMSKLLEYSQYRKYGLMLHLLKILDKQHPRHALPSRLPKTKLFKRIAYWLLTVWGVYSFYVVTMIYGIKNRMIR